MGTEQMGAPSARPGASSGCEQCLLRARQVAAAGHRRAKPEVTTMVTNLQTCKFSPPVLRFWQGLLQLFPRGRDRKECEAAGVVVVREMHRTCSLIVKTEYLICASSSYAPHQGLAPHGASQGRERKFHLCLKLGFNQGLPPWIWAVGVLGSDVAGR